MQTTTDLFERLIPLLEQAGIPYMVAGSVASSVHGSPRSTQDVDLRKSRPFSTLEFERRQVEVVDGIQLFVARPEDVLISKLEWAQMGSSDRQISDAAGILRVQWSDLDQDYVEHWVAS